MEFFDIRELIKKVPDAQYYMVYGERSGGKTYSSLLYALENFVEKDEQFVYVRRLSESLRVQYMRTLFNGLRKTKALYRCLNKLGYDDVEFYSGAFWPVMKNEKGKFQRANFPVGHTISINTWETGKGGSIPDATTIIFDEFLTRKYYLPNEPILFENVVSSVVREFAKCKIIMLGNTVSWECPYFSEWGLNHVREQKQGTFDVYQEGAGRRKIVVAYTLPAETKESDVYFNYDNPASRMITEGTWETAQYPRIPENLKGWTMGEPCYVQTLDGWCTKIQPAQTPEGLSVLLVFPSPRALVSSVYPYVDNRFKDRIIYTDVMYPAPNIRMAMTKHSDRYTLFLLSCFREGRVFYANNTVGENIRNYLRFSRSYSPVPN